MQRDNHISEKSVKQQRRKHKQFSTQASVALVDVGPVDLPSVSTIVSFDVLDSSVLVLVASGKEEKWKKKNHLMFFNQGV
jgi:hypothetical protein